MMSTPPSHPATEPAHDAMTQTIGQGECISELAQKHGHFPETIWQDEGNADLRRIRDDMNVLMPGDKVHVPAIRTEEMERPTEKRHRFRRKGVPAKLKIRFMAFGEPHANVDYQIKIDGSFHDGTTDGDGYLEEWIPPTARVAEVTLHLPESDEQYVFNIGHQDPIDEAAGVQQRLRNLGYECEASGEWDDQTKMAIKLFQNAHDIEETGTMDDSTKSKLDQLHGT
jgi:Putative peptidoglycan binding domain